MKPKRYTSFIQIVVLLLLGGLVVFSLIVPALPFSQAKEMPLEVSVLMREEDNAFWSNMRLGMEQAAYDMGGQLRFLTSDVENSHTAQSTLLQREWQGGTDALVVIPADPVQMEEMLQGMPELPVVSIESQLSPTRLCIAPDATALGRALAHICGDADTPILLLDTAGSSTGVRSRLDSCAVALKEKGIVPEIAQVKVSELARVLPGLVQQTGAKTILAFEHSATEALAAAAQELPEIALYGVGGTGNIVTALERETLRGVAAWSDYAAGYLAVQAAIQARRGTDAGQMHYPVKFSIVRGADIYEKDNQKLLFPVVN